jgi:Helix-turn-helix domain
MTDREMDYREELERMEVLPADPSVTKAEKPRLRSQCKTILHWLKRGRVSNVLLAEISLKYTSRISDLRKAGHNVKCVAKNRSTGMSWYELLPPENKHASTEV